MIWGPNMGSHFDQGAEGHHVACGIAHVKSSDVFRLHSELMIGLDVHLPGAAEFIEIVHISRSQVGVHGVEHHIQRHAQGFGLVPVDFRKQLRHAGAERGVQVAQTGLPVAVLDQLLQHILEVAQTGTASILELELKPTAHAQSGNCRGCERKGHRFLDLP